MCASDFTFLLLHFSNLWKIRGTKVRINNNKKITSITLIDDFVIIIILKLQKLHLPFNLTTEMSYTKIRCIEMFFVRMLTGPSFHGYKY